MNTLEEEVKWAVTPITSKGLVGIYWRVERNRFDENAVDIMSPPLVTRKAANALCKSLNDGQAPTALGVLISTSPLA